MDTQSNKIQNEDTLSVIVTALNDNNKIGTKASCWSIVSLTKQKHLCIYGNNNEYDLMKGCLKRCNRPDSTNPLIHGTYEAINNIIYHFDAVIRKPILTQLLEELAQQCCKMLHSENNNGENEHKLTRLSDRIQLIFRSKYNDELC